MSLYHKVVSHILEFSVTWFYNRGQLIQDFLQSIPTQSFPSCIKGVTTSFIHVIMFFTKAWDRSKYLVKR